MRKFLMHLFFWMVFFLMWNQIVNFYVSDTVNRLYFSVLDVTLIACSFYSIYFYIMPDYLRRKKLGTLVVLCFLLIVLLAGIYSWIMGVFLHHHLVPIHFDFSWDYTDLQYNRFFIALLGVLAGCFVKLAVDRIEVGRKMEIMEKEKSQAELTYLKAQINPHFLFNSLNSLYTQLDLDLEEAKGTLVSIADLLRYQLYECNVDFIPIEKELAYLENYFNLQNIRKDNCNAGLSVEGDPQNLLIAPFLLIPFVENAFKYVSDYDDQENFIKIRITFAANELKFNCINSYDNGSHQQTYNANKGIGLINVNKRLELIYSNRFKLKEDSNHGCYQVTLTLNLK
ncbi:MAG TPA: histidine kinase [Puia sp.]|nr:histidine kinase [Puia sp.]